MKFKFPIVLHLLGILVIIGVIVVVAQAESAHSDRPYINRDTRTVILELQTDPMR